VALGRSRQQADEDQTLQLTLYAHLNVDDVDAPFVVATFRRTLKVKVTSYQRTLRFVSSNWQWLWATLLAPVAAGLWRKHGRNRRQPAV
jgi:hypothetical protein